MTTINTVFPSRKWAIKAGEPRFFEHKELPFGDPTPAHEVCEFHDRHTGWYTCEDPSKDDLYVGYVFRVRVPRRMTPKDAPQDERRSGWLAGYQEGDGKHANGFLVDTSEVFLDKRDASRAADSFAERYAEKEREYQEAWQRGNRARDYIDKADTIRERLIKRLRSLNEMKRLVREEVQVELEEIYRMRRKRDEMRDCYWSEDLRASFDEGYGR